MACPWNSSEDREGEEVSADDAPRPLGISSDTPLKPGGTYSSRGSDLKGRGGEEKKGPAGNGSGQGMVL